MVLESGVCGMFVERWLGRSVWLQFNCCDHLPRGMFCQLEQLPNTLHIICQECYMVLISKSLDVKIVTVAIVLLESQFIMSFQEQ